MVWRSLGCVLRAGEGKQIAGALDATFGASALDHVKPLRGELPLAACCADRKLTNVAEGLNPFGTDGSDDVRCVFHKPIYDKFLVIAQDK